MDGGEEGVRTRPKETTQPRTRESGDIRSVPGTLGYLPTNLRWTGKDDRLPTPVSLKEDGESTPLGQPGKRPFHVDADVDVGLDDDVNVSTYLVVLISWANIEQRPLPVLPCLHKGLNAVGIIDNAPS